MTKWILVDDKLPQRDKWILGACKDERYGDWCYEMVVFDNIDKERWTWFDSRSDPGMFPPITHYMYIESPE